MNALEECLVVLLEAAAQGLHLILLRVGEVELLGEVRAHPAAVMAAMAARLASVVVDRRERHRAAERDHGHC